MAVVYILMVSRLDWVQTRLLASPKLEPPLELPNPEEDVVEVMGATRDLATPGIDDV